MSDQHADLRTKSWVRHVVALRQFMVGSQALAFLPAICLAAYWFAGEMGLFYAALGFPLIFLALGLVDQRQTAKADYYHVEMTSRQNLALILDRMLKDCEGGTRNTACMVIEIDDFKALEERFGRQSGDKILEAAEQRIRSALRTSDLLWKLDRSTFTFCATPSRRFDLETAISLAGRIQRAVEEPISVDSTSAYLQTSIGFCLGSRAPGASGQGLIEAAEVAMVEARRAGPSAIHAFSDEMRQRIEARHSLIEEVADALESGDIAPWFQPQISTDTGRVSGFEALARWNHPQRGLVSPGEFLPAVEQAGMMSRLGERMLYKSLTAIKEWDAAGLDVPSVGVNFSPDELRNPKLVDRVKWELDRFSLPPERLAIEVLESVVATADDDTITRNISALAQLGCGIDLDDFGTGHASISSIRRFSVNRIKIDRSFVMKLDTDSEQQRMLATILMMAERLELETLAEGVEDPGEHHMLAQLGCGHVQGYGIARPMPFDQTFAWLERHEQKLKKTPKVGRKAG